MRVATVGFSIIGLLVACPVAASAATQDVSDLVGARGSSGESELESRGFSISRQQGLTSYWWNPRSQRCVRTVLANGRYQSVGTVGSSDCGQSGNGAGGGNAGGGANLAQLPRLCRGEAAQRFSQSPQNISVQMPIPDHGMYSVFGQFPPNGAGTVFICTFTRDGRLVGVDRE